MLVKLMHTISSALQTPVIVLLIALAAVMVALLGMLIAEFFTERRYFKLSLPTLIDSLSASSNAEKTVSESALLWRQKKRLLELLKHPQASDSSRESLAVNMVAQEQSLYDKRVKVTDLIAKVAPMLGLMGTLIPLGPGVVALEEGSLDILSKSLLTAFDTTILGLVVAAVALLISTIRKSWYVQYMAAFEAACECVLEKANDLARSDGAAVAGAAAAGLVAASAGAATTRMPRVAETASAGSAASGAHSSVNAGEHHA